MAKKIQWGILGCGGIADKFASDLNHSKHGKLAAVGSRSARKAKLFAKQHNARRIYGSYEKLVNDPDIDVIYVATPHPFHMENTLLAINAGKHVLCEKPITMNARQTRSVIAAARKKGVFLMEGMWTRFFPSIIQMRKWLDKQRIGKVLALEADFGIRFQAGPKHRIYNPDLGGGALLDLGIYPVSLASFVFGTQPEKIASTVHLTDTGVDDHAVIGLQYADSATAALGTSNRIQMKNEARIFGTEGSIIIHEDFHRATRLDLQVEGKKVKTKLFSHSGNGMHFEADHVYQCIRKGLFESPVMGLDESLAIMQTMDKIRRQWKLKYPNE